MLDQIWFDKVSRNAESPEDVETASVTYKVNVQMDFKRVDESDIKVTIQKYDVFRTHFELHF